MGLCILLDLGPRNVVDHLKVQTDSTAIFPPGEDEAPLADSFNANSDRHCRLSPPGTQSRDSQVVGDVGDFREGGPAGHGGQ